MLLVKIFLIFILIYAILNHNKKQIINYRLNSLFCSTLFILCKFSSTALFVLLYLLYINLVLRLFQQIGKLWNKQRTKTGMLRTRGKKFRTTLTEGKIKQYFDLYKVYCLLLQYSYGHIGCRNTEEPVIAVQGLR